MNRSRKPIAFVAALALLSSMSPAAGQSAGQGGGVTLEQIMADQDWVGNPPENPYWADDGRAVFYQIKRRGSDIRDLYRLDLATGQSALIPPADLGKVDRPGEISRDLQWKVYAHEGDIFLKDLHNGTVRQITRTHDEESEPAFLVGDRRLSYRRGDTFFIHDMETGLASQAAEIRLEKAPAERDEENGYLEKQQERLFDVIRKREGREKENREHRETLQKADPNRPPLPWYLGTEVEIREASLSPTGEFLVLVTQPKAREEKAPVMPRYVTETGQVETRDVRVKVGAVPLPNQSLILLDLRSHQRHDLDTKVLPGIYDDPLKEIREKTEARRKAQEEKEKAAQGGEKKPAEKAKDEKPKDEKQARALEVSALVWSQDGRHLAVQLLSQDNKDRWIASLEPAKGPALTPRHRLTDPAWVIDYEFNDYGWLPGTSTLFYLSEESGYSQLYLDDGKRKRQLSPKGERPYEVSAPVVTRDGRYIYYTANAAHPGQYETWRVETATAKAEQLTRLGGEARAVLSPDESQLLLTFSSILRHYELYLQPAQPAADSRAARQLTQTHSAEWLAQDWIMPEVVAVPSSHQKDPIYSRVFVPKDFDPAKKYPAVVFTHGAGYLQNAHYGWSTYFREFMFHTLLAQRGYVVLDIDYRGSQGYGRDWRTAIYRQMGYPEVEDMEDGVAWLVENRSVDPARVGTYGGSYGGFLTFMAMFRKPEIFAAGAALRPVTDWAHYNHPYTANILNTPEEDSEAYERSSPIEYAAGLAKPLLICTGVEDDNVLFQDSVRLVQRLIELEKQDFETAIYPVEGHAFREPSSWLDEYRRILKLFETYLK
ncbi:MAG TPA: prolyl oligopeptidase family serine peptidase [Thermoanaerobaculia bacterium]|nr:prolyl oligopeptidase family serine peptidase [Thermoanaerobaculia bacterium]